MALRSRLFHAKLPSLAKEGWLRHQTNGPLPLKARPGWFVQQPIIGGLNQPPRLRPLRRLRGIFLMGAATPPCPRNRLRLSLQLFSMPPCPAKDVGHGKLGSLLFRFLSPFCLSAFVFPRMQVSVEPVAAASPRDPQLSG